MVLSKTASASDLWQSLASLFTDNKDYRAVVNLISFQTPLPTFFQTRSLLQMEETRPSSQFQSIPFPYLYSQPWSWWLFSRSWSRRWSRSWPWSWSRSHPSHAIFWLSTVLLGPMAPSTSSATFQHLSTAPRRTSLCHQHHPGNCLLPVPRLLGHLPVRLILSFPRPRCQTSPPRPLGLTRQ